jgi:hypothetical protein
MEWDEWARKTRAAAGQLTVRTDMAMYPTWPFVGHTRGLIASPPCKAWSMAGKRLGLSLSRRFNAGWPVPGCAAAGRGSPRGSPPTSGSATFWTGPTG